MTAPQVRMVSPRPTTPSSGASDSLASSRGNRSTRPAGSDGFGSYPCVPSPTRSRQNREWAADFISRARCKSQDGSVASTPTSRAEQATSRPRVVASRTTSMTEDDENGAKFSTAFSPSPAVVSAAAVAAAAGSFAGLATKARSEFEESLTEKCSPRKDFLDSESSRLNTGSEFKEISQLQEKLRRLLDTLDNSNREIFSETASLKAKANSTVTSCAGTPRHGKASKASEARHALNSPATSEAIQSELAASRDIPHDVILMLGSDETVPPEKSLEFSAQLPPKPSRSLSLTRTTASTASSCRSKHANQSSVGVFRFGHKASSLTAPAGSRGGSPGTPESRLTMSMPHASMSARPSPRSAQSAPPVGAVTTAASRATAAAAAASVPSRSPSRNRGSSEGLRNVVGASWSGVASPTTCPVRRRVPSPGLPDSRTNLSGGSLVLPPSGSSMVRRVAGCSLPAHPVVQSGGSRPSPRRNSPRSMPSPVRGSAAFAMGSLPQTGPFNLRSGDWCAGSAQVPAALVRSP